MKRSFLEYGMATAVGASLDDENVQRGMADRPQLPPKGLGGAEEGSMDDNAPLSNPIENQHDEGDVGVANDAKDGDATVNRNSVNGEGEFSGTNDCKENDGGVNASGTIPGSTHSTSSVAASSSSWTPPASPSSSTPLMRAAAMECVCRFASSSVSGSLASPSSSE